MVELIACAIALFIVHGIPAIIQSKEDAKKREEMYKNM
jgi:hypothetical protein